MPQTPEALRPRDRGLLSAKRLALCACSWELPSLKLSSPTAKGGDNNHASRFHRCMDLKKIK